MNPNYTEFKFPAIRAHPWSKVFSKRLPPDAVDLVRLWRQYAGNLHDWRRTQDANLCVIHAEAPLGCVIVHWTPCSKPHFIPDPLAYASSKGPTKLTQLAPYWLF